MKKPRSCNLGFFIAQHATRYAGSMDWGPPVTRDPIGFLSEAIEVWLIVLRSILLRHSLDVEVNPQQQTSGSYQP